MVPPSGVSKAANGSHHRGRRSHEGSNPVVQRWPGTRWVQEVLICAGPYGLLGRRDPPLCSDFARRTLAAACPDRHGKEGSPFDSGRGLHDPRCGAVSCLGLGDHFLDAQRVAGSSECGHIVRQIAGRAVVVPGRDHPSRWAGRVPRWYRSIWWGVSLAALANDPAAPPSVATTLRR